MSLKMDQNDFESSPHKVKEEVLRGSFAVNRGSTQNQTANPLELTNVHSEKGIQSLLQGETFTTKGSDFRSVDCINTGLRKEGQHKKLHTAATTTPRVGMEKNQYGLSTKGKVNRNLLALKDGIKTVKNSNVAKFLHLDGSNIRTRSNPCIPVETIKSQNIHRQPTLQELDTIKTKENYNISVDSGKFQEQSKQDIIDLSSIQTKDLTIIPTESVKTSFEQDSKIGERPEHKMRVVQTPMDTGGNKIKLPTEFYDTVQGSSRQDISKRSGTVGQFDPRPQNVSSSENRVEFVDTSYINKRYEKLQNKANEEFQSRF
jgi:hypothetical protein